MAGTIQLRRIIEHPTQYASGLSRKERIEAGRQFMFQDIEYPMWDENYRKVFETHFIRHFYFKEIGFETYETFKFYLETWLQINMPYYNKLFESETIKYDPLTNTKTVMDTVKETQTKREATQKEQAKSDGTFGQTTNGQRDTTANANSNEDSTGFQGTLESETPQGKLGLTAQDGVGLITHASEIDEARQTNNTTNRSDQTGKEIASDKLDSKSKQKNDRDREDFETGNELETFVYNRAGKIGVQNYSKMIEDYRKSFLRIENQIFNECNELFLQMWL